MIHQTRKAHICFRAKVRLFVFCVTVRAGTLLPQL